MFINKRQSSIEQTLKSAYYVPEGLFPSELLDNQRWGPSLQVENTPRDIRHLCLDFHDENRRCSKREQSLQENVLVF